MKITIDTKNDSKEEILKAIELIHHIIHNPSSNCLSNNSPSNNVYSDYSNSNDAFNFSSNPFSSNSPSQPFSSNHQSQPHTNPQQEFDISGFGMNDTSLNNNSNNSNISNSSNYNNYPTNSSNNYPNTQTNYSNAQNTPNIQPPQPTVYNAASNSNQPLERPIQQITPFNALFGDLQTSNLSQQSNTTPSLQKELPVKPSTELKREKPKFSVMGFETY